MVKNNVADKTVESSEKNVDDKKLGKKLPVSFKTNMEGYRMTAAWARKQMNHYGGKNKKSPYLNKPLI
jgi:hypothetical protein